MTERRKTMAADGKVTILVDVDGKQVKVLNSELDKVAKHGDKGSSSLKKFAVGAGVFKLASAAVDLVSQSLGKAITRFDTLEKYPRVMKAMGHSAEDVARSTDKLANGIDGLPTTLDEVVGTAQRLTSITKDINKSTNLTLALNNAFLASGASSEAASRGLEQYAQMLSAGKVDMQAWKTLQETMPYALQQTAEAFGFAGASAQKDFYEALKNGQITFDQFSNKLIELNDGVGGFAELAKENSKGIETSFNNIKNAIAKGVANSIKALDDLSKAATGKGIADHFDSLKVVINASFSAINASIKASTPLFKLLFSVIGAGISVVKALSPALVGVASGLAAMRAVNETITMIKALNRAWVMASASMSIGATTIKTVTAVQAVSTTMTKADMVARLSQLGVLKASTVIYGVMTGAISLSTAATIAGTAAVTALKAALVALTGPVGWVVGAIGALVAVGVSLWSWLTKESDETKKLKKEQEGLVESNKQLRDSVREGVQERKKGLESVKESTAAHQKLADEIIKLAAKENKTAGEKRNLKNKIDELNGSIDGLNLAYDKNSNSLSHNADQIKSRISAMEAESTWQTAQQNLLNIEQKRSEVSKKLAENAELRKKWNEEANVSDSVRKEKIAELTEEEAKLKNMQTQLQEEYNKTSATQQAAADAMAAAEESGSARQVIAYENMSEAQRTAIDNMRTKYSELLETTTSIFDAIEQKTALSVDQMNANLEKNRAATEQWATNLEILAQRGVDQGILEQLRRMGPEGATQTQVFVDATDAELAPLQENFRAATETAKNAMGSVLDSAGVEMPEKVKGMVTNVSTGLQAELQAANFAQLGQEIPNGVSQGISQGAGKASDASVKMGQEVKRSFQGELGIHSPSRVFTEYGGHITDGLSNGVTNGTSKVMQTMQSLAQQMSQKGQQIVNDMRSKSNQITDAFSTMSGPMHSHGVNAMQGLANGIYAGSGAALAAAQSIAARITATIQSALDIHSPSRVMRDEVGRFIPQGIAVGIDADRKVIDSSMQKLKESMTINATPEIASGFGGGVAGIANQTTNNSNNSFTLNVKVDESDGNSREKYQRLFREFSWYIQQQGRLGDVK